MYSIKFKDGTELTGLELTGNEFSRKEEIDKALFTASNLRDIEITTDGTEDTDSEPQELLGHHDVLVFAGLTHDVHSDRWLVYLREPTEGELKEARLQGSLDYLAMMIGVDL